MLQQFLIFFTGALKEDVVLDTKILRLHSGISFKIFLIASILLTIKEIFNGENINCFDHGATKDENLNAYCWFHSTYSVKKYFHDCNVYKDCIYPGVGQLYPKLDSVFHKYYQWTSVTLFFQAIIFYAPRFFWKNVCEVGLQYRLSLQGKLRFYPIITSEEGYDEVKSHLSQLTSYFRTHQGQHQTYFLEYCFLELVGFFTVILNIFLIDIILGHQFLNYGRDTVQYWIGHEKGEVNPMAKVFPLLTKCDFRVYGASGNIIPKDPICILPLNSLNDKVYLFLWFYLLIILGVSSIALLYRVLVIFVYGFRYSLLKQKAGDIKVKVVQDLCKRLPLGDWFVIYIMSNNVSKEFFQEFLVALWEEMYERKLSV